MELSEEMEEALRILRSDHRIAAFNQMTESNKALVARLDKKDADDAAWREQLEKRYAPGAGGTPPNSDTGPGNPGSGPPGQGGDGEGAPPPPEVTPPKEDEKPKRKSRWWGETEDD